MLVFRNQRKEKHGSYKIIDFSRLDQQNQFVSFKCNSRFIISSFPVLFTGQDL